MDISLKQMESELKRTVRKWHPALVRSLVRYATSRERLSRHPGSRGVESDPYWLAVPQWLMRRHSGRRRGDRKFLHDALSGQFCAFLALKIHDDLFDEHVEDRSLIFAADHLLLAARGAFTPSFSDGSPFWPMFDASIKRTLDAIIETDRCQLHGYGQPSRVLALAREGYAVCNIGTYAACLRLDKPDLFPDLVRCTDLLAFVGQVLDDFEDLQDDVQRGRVNYAAWWLVGGVVPRKANFIRRVARAFIVDGSVARFFAMLQEQLLRAGTIAATLGLPELTDYIVAYRKGIERTEKLLHRRRVQLAFDIAGR
jgi:hypothetical protein